MADTLEKRVSDIEQMLAHVPEDLDARFAGVHTKVAELREILALHTTRFSKLEARLTELAAHLARHATSVDEKLDDILSRLPPAPPKS